MESMKQLTLNGRLIISVIHQPRSSIFDMFDQLLLLSVGSTIYLGKSIDAINYFTFIGYSCPDLYNPSDYFLDILSVDNRTIQLYINTTNRVKKMIEKWNNNSINYQLIEQNQQNIHIKPLIFNDNTVSLQKKYNDFLCLCWRAFTEQKRNQTIIITRIVQSIIFGFLYASVFSNTKYNQQGIKNRYGILFIIILNQGFANVLNILNIFPKEKLITNRERSNGAYNTLSYFLSKFLIELPLNIIPGVLLINILYYIINLNPITFGNTFYIQVLIVANAMALGMAVCAVTQTVEGANAIGLPIVTVCLLFCGYFSKFFHSIFIEILNENIH